MIRKSIGLIVLLVAATALAVTALAGSAGAAFDPFLDVVYYPYAPALPSTGSAVSGSGVIPAWLAPTLAGVVGAVVLGYAAFRLRAKLQ